MRIGNFGIAAVFAGLILAAPVHATIINITWTGTIAQGNDTSNTFGVPLQNGFRDLAGQSFTALFRVDSTVGSLVSGANFYDLRGGTQFGAGNLPSPITMASLTINGQTVSFGNAAFGGYSRGLLPAQSYIYTEVNNFPAPGAADILFLTEDRFDTTIAFNQLTESLTRNVGSTGRGVFQQANANGVSQFSGTFTPTFVSIQVDNGSPSAVPEPSALSLIAGGIAILAVVRKKALRS